jgi:SAM-dependent methyltransferase
VLCTEVLEHSGQPFEVLKEIKRILKPGGHVILSTPFIYPLHEPPNDHWRFTEYGIKKICISADLDPIALHSKGGVGATLLSLGVNIVIRFVNAVSKIFGANPPLRERSLVRLTLSVPQWIFLWANRHIRTPSWVRELGSWLSPGYMIIAVNSDKISTFRN